jgi:hypothetical protein
MSSVLKFVEQLVQETSPADDFPRLEMQEGGFIDNNTFKKLYKNFTGTDQEFANFLNEQGYVLKGGKKPTADAVEMRRGRLGVKSKSPVKFSLTDKEILKEAKRLKVDTKNLSKQEIRKLTLQRRGDEVRRKRLQTDPEFVKYRRDIARKTAANIKKDPVRLARKKEMTAARQSKRIFGLVPTEKTPKGLLYRDLIENALRYQDNKLPTSHIQFLNPKNTRPKSIPETLKTKLIDTNVLDKKGKPKVITYDNVLKHIDDNKKLYGTDSKSTLKEYEKKRFIQENPDLRDQFNKKLNKTYDPTSATKRNVFSPFHIHHTAGRGQNAFNVQFATASDNMKENALRKIFNTDFKVAKTLSEKKKVVKQYLDKVPSTLEVRLKRTPYGQRETLVDITKRVAPTLSKEVAQRGGPTLGMNLGFFPTLKTAGEVLGSPAAALAFATMEVKDNLDKGESLPLALADKAAGVELLAPGAISRFAPGVMRGILGLGRAARFFTPVGAAMTVAGATKDLVREFKRRAALSDEERLKEDLERQRTTDELMVGAAKGGLIPPKSGKTPHGDKGLASLADYDMTNTEFINGRY